MKAYTKLCHVDSDPPELCEHLFTVRAVTICRRKEPSLSMTPGRTY
jgi:hypothetical protein